MAGNKKEWERKHPVRARAARKAYRERLQREQPEKLAKWKRKDQLRKYGLTVEQYDQMFRQQSGVCAICKQPEVQRRNLSVDHKHGTTIVRGLLCVRCNAAIGQLRDDPMYATAAADYLIRHSGTKGGSQ